MASAHSTARRRVIGWASLVAFVVVLLPLPALAQRVQSSVVLVRADDVISEDLYAAGNTIVVSGLIEGDLVAVAFDSIRIDGVVEGDVIALSDRVEITGRIDGALRVAARTVVFDGEVGDDVVVGGLDLQTTPGSEVGRDVVVWARTAELLGEVGRNVEGTHSRTRIAGSVAGNVDVTSGALSLLPGLRVWGDVVYTSDREVVVADTAVVTGNLIRAEALAPNLRVRGVRLLAQIVGAIGALGLGVGILWSAPARALGAGAALRRRPLASLAWGLGVASVPLAMLIVAGAIVSVTSLSSSGPLVLILLPVALAMASLVLLGLLTAPVPVSLAVGTRLRPEWSSYARFVLGFPVILALWLLPWAGPILLAVLGLAGFGSWFVADDEAP